MGPKRARFWISYKDSFVKLSLKYGQEIKFEAGGPTDEGYDYSTYSYQYFREEGKVYSSIERNARDCDGRLDTFHDFCFDVNNYKTQSAFIDWDSEGECIYDDSIQLPEWEKIRSSQRDQFAALMGY